MKKVLRTIAKSLYACVVLGAVAFTLLFVGTRIDLLGYEVKVVQSGSMEPTINTGGIVIVAPAANYEVGDVITFGADTGRRVPITHRIVEKQETARSYSYKTKGDANEEADKGLVREREIIGKVILDIPYVGYAIDFARTPLGFALLVGIPALVIILDELADIVWEIHKYRFRRRQGKVRYRTPSRERTAQQFAPPKPKRVAPAAKPKAFDVMSYSCKQRSV